MVLPGYHVYTYSFLALLSSVGGGLAIAWAVWQLPSQWVGPPPTAALWRYWGLVAVVAAGLLGSWAAVTQPDQSALTIATFSAALLGLVLVSAGFQLHQCLADRTSR